MIQDSRFINSFLPAQNLPKQMTTEVCQEPVDLLMGNTGTLVWCEKVPTLRDLLAATQGGGF